MLGGRRILGDVTRVRLHSERIQERILDQISLVLQKISLVLQIMEKIEVAVQPVPSERVPERIVEQISVVSQTTEEQTVGVLVPQITEDGLPIVPQERVQKRVAEQISGVRVPQITEDGFPGVPRERVQNRTPEQIVDVPLPQTVEERVQNRTHEQIVDSPVPQIMEAGVQVLFSMPQERVQNCTQGQIMDFPEVEQISVVPQTTEKYGQVFRPVPSERIQERLVDVGFIKGLDRYNMPRPGDVMVPVPQIMEAAVEVLHAPQECVQNRTPEQIVDVPVPPILEAVEVYAPQECVQKRTLERFVDVPVPQIIEAALEVDAPQECVQNHTLEQIVGEPVPSVMEADVEIERATPQECVFNRTPEQLVDEPVPQIAEEIVERPVPSERIHEPIFPPAVLRALQELRRRNLEQNAFEEDEEEEEEEQDAFLLISVHVSGAGSCSLKALARMDGSAHSLTMSLSSTQAHGSALCWWVAGVWVQGLGIPWSLLGCPCRLSGAGKIYWRHGVSGLASPDPLVGATQSLEVDGVRDGDCGVPVPQIMKNRWSHSALAMRSRSWRLVLQITEEIVEVIQLLRRGADCGVSCHRSWGNCGERSSYCDEEQIVASRATDHGEIVEVIQRSRSWRLVPLVMEVSRSWRLVPQIMEVDVPVVQVHLGRPLDKVVDMLVIVNDSGLQWKCLKFSSSPAFVDIPVMQQ